jgi:hypothetical protein
MERISGRNDALVPSIPPLPAQDGSLDLNAAESGVQHKPAQKAVNLTDTTQTAEANGCSC